MTQNNIYNEAAHDFNIGMAMLSGEFNDDPSYLRAVSTMMGLVHRALTKDLMFAAISMHTEKTPELVLGLDKKWNAYIHVGNEYQLTNEIVSKSNMIKSLFVLFKPLVKDKEYYGISLENDYAIRDLISQIIEGSMKYGILKPVYRYTTPKEDVRLARIPKQDFEALNARIDDKFFVLPAANLDLYEATWGDKWHVFEES